MDQPLLFTLKSQSIGSDFESSGEREERTRVSALDAPHWRHTHGPLVVVAVAVVVVAVVVVAAVLLGERFSVVRPAHRRPAGDRPGLVADAPADTRGHQSVLERSSGTPRSLQKGGRRGLKSMQGEDSARQKTPGNDDEALRAMQELGSAKSTRPPVGPRASLGGESVLARERLGVSEMRDPKRGVPSADPGGKTASLWGRRGGAGRRESNHLRAVH